MKKNPAAYEELKKEYFKTINEKGLSTNLCNYVWNVLVATSKGYGFNKSHTLAYSLIALQEMNLAYKYPLIFWNCACLITDSGGFEDDSNEEEEYIEETTYDTNFEDFVEETEEDDEEEDEQEEVIEKKKKKQKINNYGKIATAIGKMKYEGVEVTLPNINKSSFTFSPDVEHNTIIYGLSGITRISEEIIKNIILNRPYNSLQDFIKKNKLNSLQMINLIKSGAFDEFNSRENIMDEYLKIIANLKKSLNLRNMQMLINYNILPKELEFEGRVFNFNKYLKKFKDNTYYFLDNNSTRFYTSNFDMDKLEMADKYEFKIKQTIWDTIYEKYMDNCRNYITKNQKSLLEVLNSKLLDEVKQKYAVGSLSKWEMDSVSFYYHSHELDKVNLERYGVKNFFNMPEEPEVDRVVPIKGKTVPLYKITRIAGTILDKDKNKKLLSLLTKDGVVTVTIYGQVFTYYDRQISEKDSKGKKKVKEKSWLSRGNKIIVTGIRQGDKFNAKKYSKTPYHLVELITDISDEGIIFTKGEREEE